MLKSLAIFLLTLSVAGWFLVFGHFSPALVSLGPLGPWWMLVFLLMVSVIAWLPPTATAVYRLMHRLSNLSPKSRVVCAISVGIFTSAYLYLTAVSQHRQFFPYIHDEFSYLIQAHQLAKNRLWMPALPIGKFFDSFQLFTRPVYASAYFPGTAITHLPGVLMHWPPYVTSLIVSGVVAGALFWIVAEILDGTAGFLAVLLLLSDGLYRQQSILTLAHLPVMLYGLLAVIAWLRWRVTSRAEWAIGIGFFIGFAAATRPVDSLCFGAPIAIAVLGRCVTAKSFKAIAGVITGAVPFVFLQLLINHGITGEWLRTPFAEYADRQYPGTHYGFHPYDATARPESGLPQMQRLYDRYRPLIEQHKVGNILHDLLKDRLRYLLSQASPTPYPMLILLLPFSMLGFAFISRRQRLPAALVLVALPLFLALYSPYFLFLPSYVLPCAPALILGILLGARTVAKIYWPGSRFVAVFVALFIAGAAIAALPDWWSLNPEDVFRADLISETNKQLGSLPHQPAVVLFKFDPARNLDEEPVYNADVASPDSGEIVRAHDLGPLNKEIFGYYAERDPHRVFYRFDEANRTLKRLGTAATLAGEP